MTKDLISVDVQATISDAIKCMVENEIGSIIVTEKNLPVGIITERDILKKTCTSHMLCKTRIGELMGSPLITVDGDTPIGKAAELMTEKNIRRLLVTENGVIKGIVTQKDLMKTTLEVFHSLLHVGSLA